MKNNQLNLELKVRVQHLKAEKNVRTRQTFSSESVLSRCG